MKGFKNHEIIKLSSRKKDIFDIDLVNEEPLSIRIHGKPYTVVMRTPGDEISHVAGFALGEGIVSSPDDFVSLGYCDEDVNVVTATLNAERVKKIPDILMRRGFISQTSCGLCGKELIDDIKQNIIPVEKAPAIDTLIAENCLKTLSNYQPLREKTRASHAAAIFTAEGKLLSTGEDVGRHNALDKAIGRLFLDKTLGLASILILSSRISYELVQKAARAGIPIIFAISRPTALAVELAKELDITLVCRGRNDSIFIFCGEERLNLS